MSAASITAEDNTPNPSASTNPSQTTTIQTYYHHQSRPSAIPRPSTQSRPSDASSRPTQHSFTRTRTLSQPFPFDPDATDRSLASPSPTSPPPFSAVSRIPVKTGPGSISTSTHSGSRIDGRTSKDAYYAADAIGPRNKLSALINEQPPFNSDTDADSVRFSSESEERPFEHWYRGDVSRNGGVGELRVVRRKEMLDIASYGHYTKKQLSSRSASRFGVHTEQPSRRRTGSIGVDNRSSFYMEEPRSKDDLVLEEVPPSAMTYSDPEQEDDRESEMDYYFGSHTSATSPPPASFDSEPPQTTTVSRLPTPSQNRPSRDDTRTTRSIATPEPVRGSSDSPSTSSSPPPRTPTPRTGSRTPTKGVGNRTPKQKPKSPGPDRSPKLNGMTKVKLAPKAPPSAHKSRKGDESRRSVGVYPTADLEDAEHAIPTWTQPVAGSNWDEVREDSQLGQS